jgi:hypothetical protein
VFNYLNFICTTADYSLSFDVKVKVTLEEATKAQKVNNLSLTSALGGSGWPTPRIGRFTPEKDAVPIYNGLRGPQGQFGRVRKISPPPGFDSRTIQPVASRYTDCTSFLLWHFDSFRVTTSP